MRKKQKWLIPVFTVIALAIAFLVYTGIYYHADESALGALASDEAVTVTRTDYGWLFDGPSDTKALIFYPGAKVEETAYAPLLRDIAEEGTDVCLVKMPFRLSVFGQNKADKIIEAYPYESWYIGGHSLGGAVAANYAAKNEKKLKGVILLAAYPTKPLDSELELISIYGSEDGVLDMKKMDKGDSYAPEKYLKYAIEGGNHAQFGNYGKQKGDNEASLSADEQQKETSKIIIRSTEDE